jgi:GNAT superfamily N-acetyltransferase
MTSTIDVREASAADVPEILDVLRAALGEPPGLQRTEALWNWKHVDNPFGESIVLVAESGGRIAGVRAFMRWNLITPQGETVRCVRAVDTATHPDFQRRGIFRTLTLAAVEAAAADGVHLVFNTPNAKSGAGYLKMGWSEVGPIRVMVAPSPRVLRPVPESDAPLIDAPAGGPAVAVPDRPAHGLRTPRTPEYLHWRFSAHPTARYRTVEAEGSWAVLRENHRFGRPELVVSELLGPRAHKPLRVARRMSRAAYLIGSFRPGTPERRAALRAGLIPVPRVQAMLLVARPLVDIGPVTDLASWDLTIGDLELL